MDAGRRTHGRRTRRRVLREAGVLLAGALLSPLAAASRLRTQAATVADIPGWPRFSQSHLGMTFQHPPGWTVRILESGLAGASQGRDGFSGPRGYGQLFTVGQGASSGTLIYILATGLSQTIEGFRIVEAVRLAASPDLSALRFTFPYVDGLRKGTLTLAVKKGAAVLLGFDAPAAAYAAHMDTMTRLVGSFRWFESSLGLEETFEPRERAFSVMLPGGWRPDFKVVRPQVDAGFVAKATDPTGELLVEIHHPRLPLFITPGPGLTWFGPEGSWYPLGQRWGWQPLLVYRHLPGKEYLRWFLLPELERTRPGLRLVGLGDRPDLTFAPEAASTRAFGGTAAGGEAEYVWTRANGARRRGRAVALTLYTPAPGSRGPALWHAPLVLAAEAPEREFNTAVAAMITMHASLTIEPRWLAAELRGSRERWRIIRETEKILWTKYQEVIQRRQEVALAAAEKWSAYIRHTFAGRSDYGSYIPYGPDTVLTSDGQVVRVIELGGKTVDAWIKENPNGYLKKVW